MAIAGRNGVVRSWAFAFWAVGLAGVLLVSPVEAATATRTSGFVYDTTSGLLTQEIVEPGTVALKPTTVYTYDAYGNKLTATTSGVDITTRSSSNTYDAKGQFATTSTNALSQSETWTYDPKFGVPLSQTGPNDLTTTWVYDAFGRKVLETRSDGTKTAFAYIYCAGVNGGTATCPTYGAYLTTVTPLAADGVTVSGPVSSSYFDQMGRPIATTTQGFNGATVRTATEYDAYGRVLRATKPYYLVGGTAKWITNTYDTIGRVLTTTLPDSSVTSFAYHGLTTSTTNSKGQVKTETKNARGLLVTVTDAISKTITYAYDPFDNLVSTTDSAGNVSTATYDAAGRKTAMNDPDMGAWSYTYDVLGQLKTQTDAKGQVTSITYDLLGRVTQRVEPGLTSTWTYDTASMGIGKLATATTDHGYTRQEYYDGQGRPSQTSTTILGDTSTTSTYYDANGRVNQVAYPSGFMVAYSYTSLGYLSQVKDANSSQVYWTPNAYDAEGNLTQATSGNGVITNQTFDANTGFKTGIQAGIGNGVANFTYTYDTLSNLTGRTDIVQGLNETFQYDTMNRITQYAIVGGATKTVTYDDLGNIMSKSDVGTYSYNASGPSSVRPHAVASITPSGTGTVNTTYTYDAVGNMLSGNGRTTTWTSFNMVASITQGTKTVTFDYNTQHARMRQVTNTNTTLYLGGVEKVTGTSGNVQWNEYVYASGQLIGQHYTSIASGGGGTTTMMRYFVNDHLGSIAVIMNESGTVVERLSYDAWGKRRFPTGADDPTGSITSQTTKGFTGHEMIDDVGLVNMNGRVYDPQIGRFMSADPTIQNATDSQNLNRYSYVRNNPLSLVDPDGFSFWSVVKDIFGYMTFGVMNHPFVKQFVRDHAWAQFVVQAASVFCGPAVAACAAGSAAYVTGVNGGSIGDMIKAAALSAATAYAFSQIGDLTYGHYGTNAAGVSGFGAADAGGNFIVKASASEYFGSANFFANVAGHAAIGCASASASGGDCGSGAFGAAAGAGLAPKVVTMGQFGGFVASVTVGGTASVIGGGKFADGAKSAAYGYLFNLSVLEGYSAAQAGGLSASQTVTAEEARIRQNTNIYLGLNFEATDIFGGSLTVGLFGKSGDIGIFWSTSSRAGVNNGASIVAGYQYGDINGLGMNGGAASNYIVGGGASFDTDGNLNGANASFGAKGGVSAGVSSTCKIALSGWGC